MGWITKCGTSCGFFKTDDGSNIASSNFGNFFTLICEHTDETTNTFLIASCGI